MNVLLDTNICIALMRGHPRAVARLADTAPANCGISVVSVYELFTGVEKCREPERERAKVMRLLSAVYVLPFDRAAAERSARGGQTWNGAAKRATRMTCCWPVTRSVSGCGWQRTTCGSSPESRA